MIQIEPAATRTTPLFPVLPKLRGSHVRGMALQDLYQRVTTHARRTLLAGDCQPWRFDDDNERLSVVLDREQALHLCDPHYSAGLLAVGAAIQEMVIAAAHDGYRTQIRPFSGDDNRAPGAALRFVRQSQETPREMARPVPRWRQRRQLKGSTCDVQQVMPYHSLTRLTATYGCSLRWLSAAPALTEVGAIMCEATPIRQRCADLHHELLVTRRHAAESAATVGASSTLAALGLTPAATLSLTSWPPAAIGVVSAADLGPAQLLRCGQAIEQLWLQASAWGLRCQPLPGLLPCFALLDTRLTALFRPTEIAQLAALRRRFERFFAPTARQTPLFLFRLDDTATMGGEEP